jgi:hypothetical protein
MLLYSLSVEVEEHALEALDSSKTRMLGITAVNATSLWFKAEELQQANI